MPYCRSCVLWLLLSSFKPGDLRCIKVWFYAFSIKFQPRESQETQGDCSVYFIFPVPPSHFQQEFSFLPTFSGSFLPPFYHVPSPSLNWRDLHFHEHFQLEISSKCDIKAENSSTLCTFLKGRKGLRPMRSNADLSSESQLFEVDIRGIFR